MNQRAILCLKTSNIVSGTLFQKDTEMSKVSNMDCINTCATKTGTVRHFPALRRLKTNPGFLFIYDK